MLWVIGAGAAVLVGIAALFIRSLSREGERAGGAVVAEKVSAATAKAERRIAVAEAEAPKTKAEVVSRLRRRSF